MPGEVRNDCGTEERVLGAKLLDFRPHHLQQPCAMSCGGGNVRVGKSPAPERGVDLAVHHRKDGFVEREVLRFYVVRADAECAEQVPR